MIVNGRNVKVVADFSDGGGSLSSEIVDNVLVVTLPANLTASIEDGILSVLAASIEDGVLVAA